MADETNTLLDALTAVKPDDLSFNAWALKAGVNRNVWTDVRRRGRLRHDILEKLLDAAGASWSQLNSRLHPVRSEVAGTGLSADASERAWKAAEPSKPVPLLGSAIGGEWGDLDKAIELTELHLHEVLDYIARPPSLSGDPEAYCVTIVGDSMAPRFEPGERAFVSPKGIPAIGDDVIIQLKACDGDDGDRVVMVLIKRLVRRTAKFVELRQFNPDETFQVPIARIAAIHRVRGRL